MAGRLLPRQTETIQPLETNNVSPPDDNDYSSYYDGEGETIKYIVVGALAAFFLAWIVIGTVHARHRIKHGKRPLLYQRWLAPTYRAPRYYNQPYYVPYGMHAYNGSGYNSGPPCPGNAYAMSDWQQPPPPAYTANGPPQYNPPAGASKVDPFQDTRESARTGESSTIQTQEASTTDALRAPEPSHHAERLR